MRVYYRVAEDFFIFIATIAIGLAGGCKLLRIQGFFGGMITIKTLVTLCVVSLLFSIALSLLELSGRKS